MVTINKHFSLNPAILDEFMDVYNYLRDLYPTIVTSQSRAIGWLIHTAFEELILNPKEPTMKETLKTYKQLHGGKIL